MADRPILFSGPMIRALLEGRKTQTRRIVKPQPKLAPHHEPVRPERRGPRGWVWMVHTDKPSYMFATGDFKAPHAIGDRLWCRETWSGDFAWSSIKPSERTPSERIWFWADGNPYEGDWERPRPGIHMPRWASRLTLIVTDVRVERLQDISEEDADAEGFGGDFPHVVMPDLFPDPDRAGDLSLSQCYGVLWNAINGPGSWDANPWICAITFEPKRGNIDAL